MELKKTLLVKVCVGRKSGEETTLGGQHQDMNWSKPVYCIMKTEVWYWRLITTKLPYRDGTW